MINLPSTKIYISRITFFYDKKREVIRNMKKKLFKRILNWGIISLLIGATVIPIISGTLNNDYVNAYWKFDECNGDIAYDSSGHGYDGTIYGATWVGGYSGCALDFDGVDDYVAFDDYAKNYLGFNSTEDMIFSFYFKTTSTEKGVFYGMSRGDAYGYSPGVHIALASNGTIEFQVWHGGCGILMYSDDIYNDGDWHYVEVFYNGNSDEFRKANATGIIYVDDTLQGTFVYEVCSFWSDQFRYAQMGKNSSDSTDFFDGTIDEFKIIKYPGGNQPPNVLIISGPTRGEAGVEYTFTFLATDPEGDDIWLYVDWGDGTYEEWIGPLESGVPTEITHTWNENGTYELRAKARDFWGEGPWSDPYVVIIGNEPPSAPTIIGPDYGDVGTSYNYIINAVDPDGDDVRYIIEWGDTNTDTTDYAASGTDVTVPHTWTTGGTFVITAKAQDTFGQVGPETTKTVTMPRNKVLHNTLFLRLLEWFPNAFPILRYIFRLASGQETC